MTIKDDLAAALRRIAVLEEQVAELVAYLGGLDDESYDPYDAFDRAGRERRPVVDVEPL